MVLTRRAMLRTALGGAVTAATYASAVGALAATGAAAGAGGATSLVTTSRLSGANRFLTAVAISKHRFPSPDEAKTVYLATGANFPDALAAAPAATDGPVLLVGSSMPGAVRDEITRLAPDSIVALGGAEVVPDDVVEAARKAAIAGK